MKRVLIGAGLTFALLAVACGLETTQSSTEALGETACQTETISPPNGALTDWQSISCSVTAGRSTSGYGYTDCPHAYLWELENIWSNAGVNVEIDVNPWTFPSDSSTCTHTHVVYDIVGYSGTNNGGTVVSTITVADASGSWNGFSCSFSNQQTVIDPTNFNSTGNSVSSLRVEARVYYFNIGSLSNGDRGVSVGAARCF